MLGIVWSQGNQLPNAMKLSRLDAGSSVKLLDPASGDKLQGECLAGRHNLNTCHPEKSQR